MELTKINVIKIMEEEQKNQELFNTNLGKKAYMDSVYNFVDKYINNASRQMVKFHPICSGLRPNGLCKG